VFYDDGIHEYIDRLVSPIEVDVVWFGLGCIVAAALVQQRPFLLSTIDSFSGGLGP
jgi:hypothetical protein